jgi:hypothetical protein
VALSLAGAAQGIRDLLTSASEAAVGFSIPDIAGHIPTICEEFARTIANDPLRRDLLKPTTFFSATVTAGTADLAANEAAPDRWLRDFFHVTEFRKDPDDLGTPFHLLSEIGQLRMSRPTDGMFICGALSGSVLHTRNVDGALDADIGAILFSGPFVPVIGEDSADTTLPLSLEGQFQAFGSQYLLRMRPQTKR